MNPELLPLPACPAALRQLILSRHPASPPPIGPDDRPLDNAIRHYWWPLYAGLGFEYHHFWAAVLQVRHLLQTGQTGTPAAISPESPAESLLLLFCLVLQAETDGHICLPASLLADYWTSHLRQHLSTFPASLSSDNLVCSCRLPPVLLAPESPSGMVAVADAAGAVWFYTRRSFTLEQSLVGRLARLASGTMVPADRSKPTGQPSDKQLGQADPAKPLPAGLAHGLDAGQAAALERSRGRRFFILSGGPGTGKTTLAKRMVVLFALDFYQANGRHPLIRICAPTGRAASRLGQAFMDADFVQDPRLTDLLVQAAGTAGTVHRLLQELAWLGDPQTEGPDLVVIDETSMLDLRLMHRLLATLPAKTALHILGDHHQLPSVDSGAVLADLLQSADQLDNQQGAPWAARLTHCHRSDTRIQTAARLVQEGQSLLSDEAAPAIWNRHTCGQKGVFQAGIADWLEIYLAELAARAKLADGPPLARHLHQLPARDLAGLMASVVILTPLRKGPWGTVALNAACRTRLGFGPEAQLPLGLPIMVCKNDPDHGVWNGDRGIIARSPGGYKVLLTSPEADPATCPALSGIAEWESSCAMTCHKSQGSEFDTVILLVPPESGPLLSRELLYTGMTRAKERLVLATDPQAWQDGLARHTRRHSRIRESLLTALDSVTGPTGPA